MARKRYCKNREVVNVDNRLYSPSYDWEGDPNGAWHELHMGNAGSMCTWSYCGVGDAIAWRDAADEFINGTLKKHLMSIERNVSLHTQGGPAPLEIQGRLNEVKDFLKDWSDFYKKEVPFANLGKALPLPFSPLRPAIEGYTMEIVEYFDRAACYMDDLNEISEEIGAVQAVKRPPVLEPESPPDGGSWIRGGSTEELVPKTGMGVVGWMLIGVAGYFGYKALTE